MHSPPVASLETGGELGETGQSLAGRFTDSSGVAAAPSPTVDLAGPQRLVDDETVGLHGRDGGGEVALVVLHPRHVTGVVVEEAAGHPLGEVRVGLRVEDERVPADVHQRRGAVGAPLVGRAERQEGQGLIHDALREGELHGLVLDDPVDETGPELVVDEVLVGQLVTNGRLGDRRVHRHAVTLSVGLANRMIHLVIIYIIFQQG